MRSGPNVFVSFAAEDAEVCAPLLQALTSWGVSLPATVASARSGVVSPEAQAAIATCDVFLRLCTSHTPRSYAMSLETGAFLNLQAEEQRQTTAARRVLINVLLDLSYKPTPFDAASVLLDAAHLPPTAWTTQLRTALGLPPLPPLEATTLSREIQARVAAQAGAHRGELTRRRLLQVGAGAIVVAAAGGGGYLWYSHRPNPLRNYTVPLSTPAGGAAILWKFGAQAAISASPVLLGTTLYVGSSDGNLYALDTSSGTPLWSFTAGDPIYAQPAAVGKVLYLDDHSGPFYAIDATTGKQIWQAKGSAFSYFPSAVANGRIYTEANGELEIDLMRVINAQTGQDVPIHYITGITMSCGPRVVGDVVYTVGEDLDTNQCTVYALRASDGVPLWTKPLAGQAIRSTPAYGGGRIYIGSVDHHVYCFDAQSGAPAWTPVDLGAATYCAPTFAAGVVYIGDEGGVLHALDAAAGTERWHFDIGSQEAIQSTPLVTGGRIYFGCYDNHVYVIDLTGKLIAKYATNGQVHGTPAVSSDIMYVTSRDRFVYAFRLS
jgi:eukaryotic-like serine/threonine-protein kinase